MRNINTEKSAEMRGLEKTVESIRTQMRLQQAKAEELAHAVIDLFSNVPSPSAKKAVELAAGILA